MKDMLWVIVVATSQLPCPVGGTGLLRQPAVVKPAHNAIPVVAHTQTLTERHTSSNNNSLPPCSGVAHAAPVVGKCFSFYFNSYFDCDITPVESIEYSKEAKTDTEYISQGKVLLPEPQCNLNVVSTSGYPSDIRKASLRLAAIALCNLFGNKIPDCGAGGNEVCVVKVNIPALSDDALFEPWIGAAAAVAAYSNLCARALPKHQYKDACKVRLGGKAIYAGLVTAGQNPDGTHKVDLMSPAAGQMDLKLEKAYIYKMNSVWMAEGQMKDYEETTDCMNRADVLRWQHEPPSVKFCKDLPCLVKCVVGSGVGCAAVSTNNC